MKRLSLIFLTLLYLSLLGNAQKVPRMLERSIAGVVTVAVHKTAPLGKQLLGFRGDNVSKEAYRRSLDLSNAMGSGSGFILTHKGKKYVITNAHVIESASDEAQSIYIYSINRRKYEVKLVGGDSFYDVAVLQFLNTPGNEIKALKLAKQSPKLGEQVFAIGNPLGEYPYSVSDGIISAKNRIRDGVVGKYGYLQTTATMIWGNSGGPLVNRKGRVVGINSQIGFATAPNGQELLQSQLNFSLDPLIAERIIDDILTNEGVIERSFLGVEFKDSYQFDTLNFRIEKANESPILATTLEGTVAYGALRPFIGKEVKRINGNNVSNIEEVLGALENIAPGNTVNFDFINEKNQLDRVTISTQKLDEPALEKIADFIINTYTETVIDKGTPQLAINIANEVVADAQKQLYYDFMEQDTTEIIPEGSKDYFMIGAGVRALQQVWRVTTLSDLGAILKLSGITGRCSFFIIEKDNPAAKPIELPLIFSDQENEISLKLWY